MTTTTAPETSVTGDTFDSLNPANDDVVGTWPVHTKDDVRSAVDSARGEFAWWSSLPHARRKDILLTWRSVITRRMAQLAELVHRETGKPIADAQLEIVLAIDHIAWAAKNAKKVLGPRRVARSEERRVGKRRRDG